jgi:hypothetical protein
MTNECGRRTASSGDNTPRSTCWPSASYSRLRVVIRVEAFAPAQTNTAGDRTSTTHRQAVPRISSWRQNAASISSGLSPSLTPKPL